MRISSICTLIISTRQVYAFTLNTPSIRNTKCGPLNAIEVMTLDNLDNHEDEGTRLSASIAGWLDIEWMPQEVHVQMGESAKSSYIRARESGENEIMSVSKYVCMYVCMYIHLMRAFT